MNPGKYHHYGAGRPPRAFITPCRGIKCRAATLAPCRDSVATCRDGVATGRDYVTFLIC